MMTAFEERLIRVFPRRTKATPDDGLAFTAEPDFFPPEDASAVHVSCTFTWDLPRAEELARKWSVLGLPVQIGGPATGQQSRGFTPGLYLKRGYVITSRGCPNRCWFCSVPTREGVGVRELPIVDGWNVLDDNLLACSETHVRAVFAMLGQQKHRAEFTGGLEAARLQPWHVELLATLKPRPKQIFFAYDTANDYEPLIKAGLMLLEAGFTSASHTLRCYVLCGYAGDTCEKAESRMRQAVSAGFMPMAMVWSRDGSKSRDWTTFQRKWARPAFIAASSRSVEGLFA